MTGETKVCRVCGEHNISNRLIKLREKVKNKCEILGFDLVDIENVKTVETSNRFNVICISCGTIINVNCKDILKRNRMCPYCRPNLKRKTIEEITNICNKDNFTILTDIKSTASIETIKLKCNICGLEKETLIGSLYYRGCKCLRCIGQYSPSQEEAEKNVLDICNMKNITLIKNFIYTNNKTLIKLKCNKCGYEWATNYQSLLSGKTSCSSCYHKKIIWNYIPKEIKLNNINERCNEMNYEFLGWLSENEEHSTKDKIKLKCKKHNHIWSPTYKDFMMHKGCPICALEINVYENRLLIALKKRYNDLDIIYQYKNKEILNRLSIDFYIPKYNIAIELQGEHHFKPIVYGKNVDRSIYDYNNTIERDKRKNKICKDNNINLLYFSYSRRYYIPNEYIDLLYINEENLFTKIDNLILSNKILI